MSELKCPHCGRMFTVDDAEMNAVVKQIRDAEFHCNVAIVAENGEWYTYVFYTG